MHYLVEKLLSDSNLTDLKTPDLQDWQSFLCGMDKVYQRLDQDRDIQQRVLGWK